MHMNKTPSPERSYKHTKSPWTADRLKKKTKTSPAWKGLPDVLESEEVEDFTLLRSSSSAFEFPGPLGQEGEEAWPGSSSDSLAGYDTSTSATWPELPDSNFPMAGLHHSGNISASWPNIQQEYQAANDSLILQTSLSADCLLQPPISAVGSGQQTTCSHRHQATSQQSKAPYQESSVMLDSETDENRPPLPFNVSNMPASLTERVRQQAKTRVSRVRVVRKAAVNTGSIHSASLDFGKPLQPLEEPFRAALHPKGITSAFQLSWPPPAALATVVGAAPTTNFPVSFTESMGSVVQQLKGSTAAYESGACHRSLNLDTRSQNDVADGFCLSPAVQGKAAADCSERFSVAQDSDLCLAPVACDSPALALAQRPCLQLSHGVPHDSATSLVRLDMHLLPSPLSKGVAFAAMGKNPHASPDPHGSLNAHMWPSTMSDRQGTCVRKGLPPQLSLGTHAVPMIISPDDHHGMNCQDDGQEEEFILYSAPLIDSPGSDTPAHSEADSPEPASPNSPAQRSILPNSAPGFSISPFPMPLESAMHPSQAGPSAHVAWSNKLTGVPDSAAGKQAVLEVDDVNELNMLLKKMCRLGSDPKDAEEFVDQACKNGRIMPNATTVNNLNKLWDTHEQLHG